MKPGEIKNRPASMPACFFWTRRDRWFFTVTLRSSPPLAGCLAGMNGKADLAGEKQIAK
jgi:hypothetical protein